MQCDAKQLIVAQVPAGSGLVVRGEEGRLGHAYKPGRRAEGACSWTGGGWEEDGRMGGGLGGGLGDETKVRICWRHVSRRSGGVVCGLWTALPLGGLRAVAHSQGFRLATNPPADGPVSFGPFEPRPQIFVHPVACITACPSDFRALVPPSPRPIHAPVLAAPPSTPSLPRPCSPSPPPPPPPSPGVVAPIHRARLHSTLLVLASSTREQLPPGYETFREAPQP